MKSILKQFLPLIIGLFIIMTITVVLLFVFVDCEQGKTKLKISVVIVEMYSENEKIEDTFIYNEQKREYNATINHDGYNKMFRGTAVLNDGTIMECSISTTIARLYEDGGGVSGVDNIRDPGGYWIHLHARIVVDDIYIAKSYELKLTIE